MAKTNNTPAKHNMTPSRKELVMKSANYIAALAVIIAAMSLPLRADIIADQSLISITAPQVPDLDQVNWWSVKNGNSKY